MKQWVFYCIPSIPKKKMKYVWEGGIRWKKELKQENQKNHTALSNFIFTMRL